MLASLTLALTVILTSVGAYAIAVRSVRLSGASLAAAVLEALDYLGLAVLFLFGNLAVGITLIFGLRAMSGRFVSVYILNDVALALLSCLQALVVHCWRMLAK